MFDFQYEDIALERLGLTIKGVYKGCKVSPEDEDLMNNLIKQVDVGIELKEAINNHTYKV